MRTTQTRKILLTFGTRPEAIKLAPVICEMRQPEYSLEPVVCVTGQHRDMLDPVLDWFGIVPDHDLNLMQANQGLSDLTARALTGLHKVLSDVKPDAVLVQGDTTTAMAASIAAFHNRLPLGHVEAGLRTRDLSNPFPEELNRRIAGLVARFHFAPTSHAANALMAEQVSADQVFTVGNTVVDALRLTQARAAEVQLPVCCDNFRTVLVTAHRRESFGAPLESICLAVRDLAERNSDLQVIFPVHRNPNVRDITGRILQGHPRIHLMEPLRYEQFAYLMSRCDLILTDSGGVQEEATFLRRPTLILRDTTERPEAIAAGRAALIGTDRRAIVAAAETSLKTKSVDGSLPGTCPFGDGYAAARIARILSEQLQ